MPLACDAASAEQHCLTMWSVSLKRQPGAPDAATTSALAVEELHDEVDDLFAAVAGGLAEVDDVDDVLVPDVVDRFGLVEEARDDVLLGDQLFEQHLDGDALADQRMLTEVHGAHAAFADLAP